MQKNKQAKFRKPIWISIAAGAACLGITGGILAWNGRNGMNISADALALAEYPEAARYPDESKILDWNEDTWNSLYTPWEEQNDLRREAAEKLADTDSFYQRTIHAFLSGAENENRVYSPVNVYMALAMLAETAGGESRAQLLSLLETDTIEDLRKQAKNLWTANYRDDGATTCVLANSLWLDESFSCRQETLETLARDYFASSFAGETGSPEMNQQLRNWLDEQTGGLLRDATRNAGLNPDTVLALCSTVYFRAKWDQTFSESENERKIFHAAGGDTEAEFMNGVSSWGPYYWGDTFGAVQLNFADGGCMWLILPDEGKTPDEVLASGEYLEMLLDAGEWENQKTLKVRYCVPKFDVSSEIDLKKGLKRLGAGNLFNIQSADFTPLSEEELFVGEVKHAARVTIDEEGCTAAAFTKMEICGAAMPPEEEMDFVLDRPFLFVIQSDMGQPLFTGVVNTPLDAE